MSDAPQLAAHLEKLYEAATATIPEIAGAFGQAGRGFSALFFSYALARDPHLGMSDVGPSLQLAAFASTMRAATVGADSDLTDVAANLKTTAQDLARTDDEVRRLFVALGGSLS